MYVGYACMYVRGYVRLLYIYIYILSSDETHARSKRGKLHRDTNNRTTGRVTRARRQLEENWWGKDEAERGVSVHDALGSFLEVSVKLFEPATGKPPLSFSLTRKPQTHARRKKKSKVKTHKKMLERKRPNEMT